MSDLIDRQAAIDAPVKMVSEGLEWIPVYHIKDLPSAQPEKRTHERTETHACDLIDRQAAIEINRSYHGQMPNEVNHRIWKEINELPSAQPEIVKCKNCIKQPLCKFSQYQGNDGYCSLAERRTDEVQRL